MNENTTIHIFCTPIYRTENTRIVENDFLNDSNTPYRDITRTTPISDFDGDSISFTDSLRQLVLHRLIIHFPTKHPKTASQKTVVLVIVTISSADNPILFIHVSITFPFPVSDIGAVVETKSTSLDAPREVPEMNLKRYTEGGETARRQCFFNASFRGSFSGFLSTRPKRGGGYGCSPPHHAGNLSLHPPTLKLRRAKRGELYEIPPPIASRAAAKMKLWDWRIGGLADCPVSREHRGRPIAPCSPPPALHAGM